MKFEWKTCWRIGLTAFLLFLCMRYWGAAVGLLALVRGAAAPLLLGCLLAYAVNILMSFYEKYWFPARTAGPAAKSRRPVCMIGAFLTLAAIAVVVVSMVLPELVKCVQLLGRQIPVAINMLLANKELVALLPPEIVSLLDGTDWQSAFEQLGSGWISGALATVGSVVSTVFSGVVSWFLAIIFSVYLLVSREKLLGQSRRLMRTYLKPRWDDRVMYILRLLNDCFHRYIVGQCIEAVILGTLCGVGMLILRMPYAVMIGALVGATALIPIMGAYIGAGVGALMILTISPMKALGFLVFILVLQQVEGNIIYPRVVGSSIGLPGIWVLTAVTLGGGVAGIPGMLLGVPLASALYRMVREDLARRKAAETQPQNV